ncbi:TRAP transporter solute receptor, TAXI family [Fusarium oxysporum f. sp. vasinfectum]|nr:TRAP transporter solute receptor, TAXI family [Fusarium oxysporum f. sp. vasinfectum]
MGEPASKILDRGPAITRSVNLNFQGDWGQANFHRIMSWLTQEFCDRCGPRSRVAIFSMRGGGSEGLSLVNDGEMHIALGTPVGLMAASQTGDAIFGGQKFPQLQIREKKPPMKLVIGPDTPDSPTGWISHRFLEAHGITAHIIRSWGGEVVDTWCRPEQCLIPVKETTSDVTAAVHEAIMTPWWTNLIDGPRKFVPIPAEPEALEKLHKTTLLEPATLPPGYWDSLKEEIPALSFRDFLLFCREDLPDDIAYLLTWCLVETKGMIESQYYHIDPNKTPLGYPFDPVKMAKTSIPLHPAAERYYREHGYVS